MLEMSIDSIRVSLMNYQRVVILKEKDTDRYLPIWIGPSEADAIAVKLQDVSVPRPLTHDLLGNVIDAMGGVVKRIVVSDLQNDTFYAKIILEVWSLFWCPDRPGHPLQQPCLFPCPAEPRLFQAPVPLQR